MAIPQQEKVLTSLAGEFLVAGQLCLMGYNASLTLKNFPKTDIFAFNPKNNKTISIQIKTKKGGKEYFVPEKIDTMINPFVFVYINSNNSVDYYIVPAFDVAKISHIQRKEYTDKNPQVIKEQPRMVHINNLTNYKDKWNLLGLD